MKIVDLDGYAANPGDLSWEAFEQLGDLVVYDNTSPEQIIERAKDAEILLVNKIELNKDIISQLPKSCFSFNKLILSIYYQTLCLFYFFHNLGHCTAAYRFRCSD